LVDSPHYAARIDVLAISSYGVLGGAELAMDAFLAHRPPGVDARVLLLTDGPVRDRLQAQGLGVAAAQGMEGRPDPARAARFTRPLLRDLRARRPEVVWAIGQKAALLALPACRALGVPLVWHKVDFSWDRSLSRPLAAAVDGVVAVSHAVTEPLGPWRERRLLSVVGVPITLRDDPPSQRPEPGDPVIGTLGRLLPYKGHHHILRAAALLSDEFPRLRVVLAGGPVKEFPDYPDELRALAAELGLADRVELPGFVGDIAGVLRRLTVFVSATYRDEQGFGMEALGAGIIEAGWTGVPAVAVALGGTAESVLDGRTGTLVAEADPALLAPAIAAYLRDPALRARAGEEGRRFARAGFAPEAAAGRLFDALARVA
jgi:glycosyltransferase involved in cell wall biosynthesis